MKYFVGVTLAALVFVMGKVFGIYQSSITVDFMIAIALMLSWFIFIIANVEKTTGGKAFSDEYGHQDHPYMLMV